MDKQEINNLLKVIAFFERLNECYMVQSFYTSTNGTNLLERQANLKMIKKLEIERKITELSFKLQFLYNEIDRAYTSMIENELIEVRMQENEKPQKRN